MIDPTWLKMVDTFGLGAFFSLVLFAFVTKIWWEKLCCIGDDLKCLRESFVIHHENALEINRDIKDIKSSIDKLHDRIDDLYKPGA